MHTCLCVSQVYCVNLVYESEEGFARTVEETFVSSIVSRAISFSQKTKQKQFVQRKKKLFVSKNV